MKLAEKVNIVYIYINTAKKYTYSTLKTCDSICITPQHYISCKQTNNVK